MPLPKQERVCRLRLLAFASIPSTFAWSLLSQKIPLAADLPRDRTDKRPACHRQIYRCPSLLSFARYHVKAFGKLRCVDGKHLHMLLSVVRRCIHHHIIDNLDTTTRWQPFANRLLGNDVAVLNEFNDFPASLNGCSSGFLSAARSVAKMARHKPRQGRTLFMNQTPSRCKESREPCIRVRNWPNASK